MDKKNSNFSIKARIKSFHFAFKGLKNLLQYEHNSRIHILAAIIAVIVGFVLDISIVEWILIIFAIGLVFICEIINTALENLCDFIEPNQHLKIGLIKDLASAAVLVASGIALLVGALIFIPKVL